MPCCVNLPLRWAHGQPLWLDWFESGRLHPEFGLDEESLALPDAWHEAVAVRFRKAGLCCAVHLPFAGVDPCADDSALMRKSVRALRRGADLAALYGATHMVGHPYCPRGSESGSLSSAWLDAALAVWPELPGRGRAPLFLENTYEMSMAAVAGLAAIVGREAAGSPRVGVCLDVGHWRAFAGQSRLDSFLAWLDMCADLPLHLHLHDNNGSGDQHAGLGRGNVPLEEIFAVFEARDTALTATLEPHDVESFVCSVAWLAARPAIARRVHWEKPRTRALPFAEMRQKLAR